MGDDILIYEPTERFSSTNILYRNHFRFHIEALPDLTFFAQSVVLPSILSSAVKRATPFATVQEVGDHLEYGTFDVNYRIDAQFKAYTSLLWWLQGYGFPHSYEEVKQFRETRSKRIANPRPIVREVEKTSAILYILEPDTEKSIVEIQFSDVFPVSLGQLDFVTTSTDAAELTTVVTFRCTVFDVVPTL